MTKEIVPKILHLVKVFHLLSIHLNIRQPHLLKTLLALCNLTECVIQKCNHIFMVQPWYYIFDDANFLQSHYLKEISEPQYPLDIPKVIFADRNLSHRVIRWRIYIVHDCFEGTGCGPEGEKDTNLGSCILRMGNVREEVS
jgi:hypothetical protein